MKPLRLVWIPLLLSLAACAGTGANREAELVENGYTAMSGGDYVTAEYLLDEALRINDKNPYALLNLGVVYQETERYDKARQFYQSVIDLNPTETAEGSNDEGFVGKNLADIARTNLQSLPVGNDDAADSSGDSDKDGIPNALDQCDSTPADAAVGDNGCWTLVGIFPSGKTSIDPKAHEQLAQVITILEKNPSLRIEIQGHTDNLGSPAVNKRLSEIRAQSVMLYLIEQGITAERLVWTGQGQSRPTVSNKTAEGRRLNRRVELIPIP